MAPPARRSRSGPRRAREPPAIGHRPLRCCAPWEEGAREPQEPVGQGRHHTTRRTTPRARCTAAPLPPTPSTRNKVVYCTAACWECRLAARLAAPARVDSPCASLVGEAADGAAVGRRAGAAWRLPRGGTLQGGGVGRMSLAARGWSLAEIAFAECGACGVAHPVSPRALPLTCCAHHPGWAVRRCAPTCAVCQKCPRTDMRTTRRRSS